MRKILLILTLLLTIPASCFAFEVNSNKWEWVTSDDTVSVYLRRGPIETYRTASSDTGFVFWTLTVDEPHNEYTIEKKRMLYVKRMISFDILDSYDLTTNYHKSHHTLDGNHHIVPGSTNEALYENICKRFKLRPY